MERLMRITTVPTSMKTLLKGQLRFMKEHYEVLAVSSDGDCFEAMLHEQGDIQGERVPMTRKITPLKDLKALISLVALMRKYRPHIVHTHTPKAGLLGMLAARIAGVPHRLHTIAGLPLLEATGTKRMILNAVERLTNACATHVYPNSFVMRDIMAEQRLASQRKMKVLLNGSSNGIDTEHFNPESLTDCRSEIRERLDLSDDEVVFIFVGRVVKDKGINELARAFRDLPTGARLLVVGDFERELDPIDLSSEHFLFHDKRVKMLGYQNDVRGFLLAADVLVFPSYREGFPNVVMQAGAMNLPSIVTDINGCNEIIVENKNGIIIPPKNAEALRDAMAEMMHNAQLRRSMSELAREMIVDRYDQKELWQAILSEYKSLN